MLDRQNVELLGVGVWVCLWGIILTALTNVGRKTCPLWLTPFPVQKIG